MIPKTSLSAALIFLLTSCGSPTPNKATQEEPKTTKVQVENTTVAPNDTILISAPDNNDASTTYLWLDESGKTLGNEKNLSWKAPNKQGMYTIVLVLNFQKPNQTTSQTTIEVKLVQDPTFNTIKKLIQNSKDGLLDDVTYINVGDSTRTYTHFSGVTNHAEKIFDAIKVPLQNANVTTYLQAQGGQTFKTYLDTNDRYETNDTVAWENIAATIALIPADGEHTILDISLGANDFSRLNEIYVLTEPDFMKRKDRIKQEVKAVMLKTIAKFRESKPKVKIMLTSPNPLQDWEHGSDVYQGVYKEVAEELKLPFANFVDDAMPPHSTTEFFALYHDNIHFNDAGMTNLANFTLGKILPQ